MLFSWSVCIIAQNFWFVKRVFLSSLLFLVGSHAHIANLRFAEVAVLRYYPCEFVRQEHWSGRHDSNVQFLEPKSRALPNLATTGYGWGWGIRTPIYRVKVCSANHYTNPQYFINFVLLSWTVDIIAHHFHFVKRVFWKTLHPHSRFSKRNIHPRRPLYLRHYGVARCGHGYFNWSYFYHHAIS